MMNSYAKIGHQLRMFSANNGTNFDKEKTMIENQALANCFGQLFYTRMFGCRCNHKNV